MAAEPFENECCADMVSTKQWIENHEKRHATLDDILDKLLNRLPLWATVILSLAGGVIGSLITIVLFLANAVARTQ